MARVIINSDDFGYNESVNAAIAEAFAMGWISSTSFITNFEHGYSDAAARIALNQIPQSAIGIHFNLTEGIPLTDTIKHVPRFCDQGVFHGKVRQQPLFALKTLEKRAVLKELDAQINKCRALGFQPSHIDSHHHIHTEWAILPLVLEIASIHGIKKIRLSRNIGPDISPIKKIYKYIFNTRLKSRGIITTAYMGDFNDYMHQGLPSHGDIEIMVHACYHNSIVSDLDYIPLSDKLSHFMIERPLNLCNFSQL